MCELLAERRIFCGKRCMEDWDAEGNNGGQKSLMVDRCRKSDRRLCSDSVYIGVEVNGFLGGQQGVRSGGILESAGSTTCVLNVHR